MIIMQDAQAHAGGPNKQQQQEQSSPFLHCLSQLNDDVLATYLLPKLVEQGSAGALVLICSQLRALCQPGVQHLDLSKPQLRPADNPCHHPELAQQLVAAFPRCTSLAFAWGSSSRMINVHRGISTLLLGLRHLSTISITHRHGSCADLHLEIRQLHTHATALRCLSLQLSTGLGENCNGTWASLGKLDTLTRLQLSFDDSVLYPCTQEQLRALRGLTNLQSLIIKALGAESRSDWLPHDAAQRRLAVEQFPGHLTALTELQLPLEAMQDISSVSACDGLLDLRLCALVRAHVLPVPLLQPREWAAVAQLTHLSCLVVEADLAVPEEAEAYFGVLKQLPGLQVVGCGVWKATSALPVLQSLTHLTAVHGSWYAEHGWDLSGLVCPHIRELCEARGSVPFQAVPNLLSLSCCWRLRESLRYLSRHCTGLQRLVLTSSPPHMWCVQDDAERIAAYRSLAHLQHMSHLELPAQTDAELLAFTSTAAAAGGCPQLRYLHVRGPLSVFALMQLPCVRGLRELSVHMVSSKNSKNFPTMAVRSWLVGLAVVPKVFLRLELDTDKQRGIVEAARQWAGRCGLPLPADLRVSVI